MNGIGRKGWLGAVMVVALAAAAWAVLGDAGGGAAAGASPMALSDDGACYAVDTVETGAMPFAFLDLNTMEAAELENPLENERSEGQIMAAVRFIQKAYQYGAGGQSIDAEHPKLKAVYVASAIVDSQGGAKVTARLEYEEDSGYVEWIPTDIDQDITVLFDGAQEGGGEQGNGETHSPERQNWPEITVYVYRGGDGYEVIMQAEPPGEE